MSAYEMTVKFTPLCGSCGDELQVGVTQSRPSEGFDRDNPFERCDRRVFVTHCPKCFTFTGGKSA